MCHDLLARSGRAPSHSASSYLHRDLGRSTAARDDAQVPLPEEKVGEGPEGAEELVHGDARGAEEAAAAAKAKASAVIDGAYSFDFGPIAFKPTYTTGKDTFRSTRAGALPYFVGPDPSIPQFGKNQGFATYRHWKSCEIEDYVIQLFGNTANTMGLVRVTDSKGQVGVVEKTWTFVREINGTLRIVLHHSSAPFDAR